MYIREQASKQASKEASLYFPIIKLVTLNNLQLFRNYHKNFSISLFFVPPCVFYWVIALGLVCPVKCIGEGCFCGGISLTQQMTFFHVSVFCVGV